MRRMINKMVASEPGLYRLINVWTHRSLDYLLYDMTKTQSRALASLIFVILATFGIAWIAYDKHRQATDEGLVYLGLFHPDPSKIEFENVVVLSRPSTCESGEAHYKGLPAEAVQDFVEANKKGVEPIRLSVLEGEVPIVSWEDTKRLFEKGTTKFFRPKGHRLLKLSRVGFNKQKTEAIACVEISDGSFGEALLIHLRNDGHNWSAVEIRNIWIS